MRTVNADCTRSATPTRALLPRLRVASLSQVDVLVIVDSNRRRIQQETMMLQGPRRGRCGPYAGRSGTSVLAGTDANEPMRFPHTEERMRLSDRPTTSSANQITSLTT